MQNAPYVAFVRRLVASYEVICVIGKLAIEEWMENRSRRGERVSVDTLVPRGVPRVSVPILHWDGRFMGDVEKGSSVVFPLQDRDFQRIIDLFDDFLWRDAVAFLVFERDTDELNTVRKALEKYRTDMEIVESLTREAIYILRSQGERESLEVLSRWEGADHEVEAAMEEAVQSITSTPWYQQNRDKLAWDDFYSCLMLR